MWQAAILKQALLRHTNPRPFIAVKRNSHSLLLPEIPILDSLPTSPFVRTQIQEPLSGRY